ncbi:MAG: hypothetical protein WD771_06700 [Gemmatimonadaceae bacterium]
MTPSDEAPDLDLFGAASAYLRHLKVALGIPATLVVLVGAIILTTPRRYTVTVAFTPTGQSGAGSQLAGLAAQFGLAGAGGSAASESPDFYADLVRSDFVLQAVVQRAYVVPRAQTTGMDTIDLVAAFGTDTTAPAVMREVAADELRSRLRVKVAPKTGIVSVSVWTEDPGLSVQIVGRILDELGYFNRLIRQSQARDERIFLQGRVDSAQSDLREAQDRMQVFLQRNRDFAGSPQLQFEHARIQQDISVQQALYSTLAQAYENARIEEVRATPVLTVVQPPVLPARPDRRGLVTRSLLTGILGWFVGLAMVFFLDMLEQRRRNSPADVAVLADLWRARRDGFSQWVRSLGRVRRSGP